MPNIDVIKLLQIAAYIALVGVIVYLITAGVVGLLTIGNTASVSFETVTGVPWTDVGMTDWSTWLLVSRTEGVNVLDLLQAFLAWVCGFWTLRLTVGLYAKFAEAVKS